MMGYTEQDVEKMKDAISDSWRRSTDKDEVDVLRSAYDLLDGLIVEGRL